MTAWEFIPPKTLESLMSGCEAHCVAECCGLEAFDVDVKPMKAWIQREGIHAARGALIQLERLIDEVTAQTGEVSCTRMNAWWPAPKCVEYLERWRASLATAIRETPA